MVNYPAEKRQSPRVKTKAYVRYQIRGRPEFNNVLSDNISVNGVGILTDEFLAPSTDLMLEISILSRLLTPIGSVVWSMPVAHTNRYKTGIKFIEFDPLQKNFLNDYINMRRGEL